MLKIKEEKKGKYTNYRANLEDLDVGESVSFKIVKRFWSGTDSDGYEIFYKNKNVTVFVNDKMFTPKYKKTLRDLFNEHIGDWVKLSKQEKTSKKGTKYTVYVMELSKTKQYTFKQSTPQKKLKLEFTPVKEDGKQVHEKEIVDTLKSAGIYDFPTWIATFKYYKVPKERAVLIWKEYGQRGE